MPWWGKLIYGIGTWITIFPILIGFYKFKKLNKTLIPIFIWMICMGLIQMYSSWQSNQGINNMASRHLMTFLDAGFGGYFFYHILKSKRYKTFVLVTCILTSFFTAYNAFFIITLRDPNPIALTIVSYGLMVWSFIYLFELLRNDDVINLFQSPEFYIVIGILLYFGTTQLVQLLQFIISFHMQELKYVFRYVDGSFMIAYYFLIGIGLWKKR